MARTADTSPNCSKVEFLTLLEKHRGLVSYAIKESGLAIQTYYTWMKDDPDFKQKADQINESVIDWVESKLYENVETNNAQLIQFYLKAKARQRGYADKLEIESNQTIKHDINIKFED